MPVPSLVKSLSFVPSPRCCVYISWHIWPEDLVRSLPPSTGTSTPCIKRILPGLSNNLLEAMETDLIRVLINLLPPAKQSQKAGWEGTELFPLPQDTLVPGKLRVRCVFLGAHIFLGKVQGFHFCPKPNAHETLSLNSTEPFKSLASPWLIHFGSFPEQLTN